MRIIVGKFKGIELKSSKLIRPTEQKVKKPLFDTLGNSVIDTSFLDLFAGSGSVGIEALSRGAKSVVFVEKDRHCCEIIKDNLNKIKQNAKVINLDTEKALDLLSGTKNKFDIIFLDPPYYKDLAPRLRSGSKFGINKTESLTKKTLQKVASCDILSPCALIIAQHYKKDILEEAIGSLTLCKIKRYGDTVLSFYQNK